MNEAERLARLRLARSEGVGARTFGRLLAHCGSAVEALEALPRLSARGGRAKPVEAAPAGAAMREAAAVAALGGRLVVLGEDGYPEALSAIDDPPPALSVLGDVGLLGRSMVAVVGARNASAAGRKFARGLAADLGAAGVVVCSGMARGIDGAAHEGALASGTAAVLAGGVDVPYPREHGELYQRLVESGAVLAEHPIGTVPTARHFPARNRLISGLALGVVVVEATLRSGSLITARFANEQGRVVMAVPGSPLDPRAKGANDLLRQGAVLVESADEVVEAVRAMAAAPRPALALRPAAPPPAADPVEEIGEEAVEEAGEEAEREARAVLAERLGAAPVTVDEMVRECQLSAAAVQTILLELELAGRIARHPGNRVSLLR